MNELQRMTITIRQQRLAIQRDTHTTAPETSTADTRYRLLVSLVRSDRPRYWNFLCHNCGHKVVEIQNYEVIGLDDFYDPENVNNAAIGRHCVGNEKRCPYTYFFVLR